MTDRINSLTVVLERDIREDDIAPLMAAIESHRGVLQVLPHVADGIADVVASGRIRAELGTKIMEILYP